MSSVNSRNRRSGKRRLATEIKGSLRELNNQLALLNHQVSAHAELKPVDFDCLELLNLRGPLSPTALARLAGLHPATMTGVIDRLQRAGWVSRDRDPDAADRRAVTVRALRDRNAELFGLFAGMNAAMDGVCADYTEDQLELIAGFLRRTTEAGRAATDELSADNRSRK